MLANVVERLTDVPAPVIVVAVAVLACAETAAFIGLAAPGELSVVFGGVLAFQGRVPLPAVMSAAAFGAILGDSLGFYLGRRFGGHLTDGRIGRMMGPDRVERTMARIRAGGQKAIVLGRFVGVLRAVMPFAAGASGMRYVRFVVASLLGATSWAVCFTLLGYLAGNSWRRVETYAGRASTVLAVLLVTVVLLVMLARKLSERQDRVRAAWQGFLDRPRIAAFRARYHREIAFLLNRFRPGPAAGLQLTGALAGLTLLGYAVAVVIGQVVDLTGLAAFDRDVREAFADQPAYVTVAAGRVHAVLSPAGCAVLSALTGLAAWLRDHRPRALVLLAVTVAGAVALVEVVGLLVTRPNPLLAAVELADHTFPAQATTVVAGTAVALLVVVLPRLGRWHVVVGTTVAGLGVVILAGLAELLAARAFLSDVVGGAALGALWGLAVATALTTMWPAPPRRSATPTEVGTTTRSG